MGTTNDIYEARKILKTFFGFSSFKGEQEEIIQNVMDDKNTFVVMPTGGGKSLCFQIPALLKEGAAIVVSPLIALMKDQVEGLVSNGVKATFLNSSQSPEEQDRVMRELEAGTIKMLYVSPEKLVNDHFLSFLPGALVNSFQEVSSHFFMVIVILLGLNLIEDLSGSIFSYNL